MVKVSIINVEMNSYLSGFFLWENDLTLSLWFCHFMTNTSSFPLFNLYHDIEKSCRIWLWNIAFFVVEVGVLKETQKFTSAKKVSIIMENFLNLNFSERILSQNLFQVLQIQGRGSIKIICNISLVFSNVSPFYHFTPPPPPPLNTKL